MKTDRICIDDDVHVIENSNTNDMNELHSNEVPVTNSNHEETSITASQTQKSSRRDGEIGNLSLLLSTAVLTIKTSTF